MIDTLSWSDFTKVDMRVGTVIEAHDFPEANNPSYQIHIDFGPELGRKKSSAQLAKRYTKEELLGKQVVAVVNFPKNKLRIL